LKFLRFFLLAFSAGAWAQAYGQRDEVRAFIDDMVKRHGFVKSELDTLFARVQRNDAVLDLVRTPPEKPVWEDYRDVAERVFATRVLSDGTVPALASLVSATAEPGLARLHWFSPDGASFEAGVERARGAGPFAEIARVRADGTGHVRYDDRDVTPRATYRYRLAVTENGATSWLGEVTLRVPEGSRLALAGFVPNPAVGKPRLAYTLPTAQRARIEVLDIAGRRVLERDLDSSPGEHVVAFDAALGPGVYTLRLTQGSRSVTARATIVR